MISVMSVVENTIELVLYVSRFNPKPTLSSLKNNKRTALLTYLKCVQRWSSNLTFYLYYY